MITKGFSCIFLVTALLGCIPEDTVDRNSDQITGKVAHKITGDRIKLTGTIFNTSPEAVCLGKPSLSLKYPDPNRSPEALFLGPFDSLGYTGIENPAHAYLVIPAEAQMVISEEYRIPPLNAPYSVVLGGDEQDQAQSEAEEKAAREKGDYVVDMGAYKFICPTQVIQEAKLRRTAFLSGGPITLKEKKLDLTLYVGSVHISHRK